MYKYVALGIQTAGCCVKRFFGFLSAIVTTAVCLDIKLISGVPPEFIFWPTFAFAVYRSACAARHACTQPAMKPLCRASRN